MPKAKSVHSLKDLRDLFPDMELPMRPAREPKPRKCRICGADMELIAGSNVWVCHGTIEKPDPCEEDPDRTKTVPCANFALAK